MTIEGNKLIPTKGKWLYNGEVCSDLVYIGKSASVDEWTEVDEYIEPISEEEATIEDYEAALAELGVK